MIWTVWDCWLMAAVRRAGVETARVMPLAISLRLEEVVAVASMPSSPTPTKMSGYAADRLVHVWRT